MWFPASVYPSILLLWICWISFQEDAISSACFKRCQKTTSLGKRKIIHSTFTQCQFLYAALIWLFCRAISYFEKRKKIIEAQRPDQRSSVQMSFAKFFQSLEKLSVDHFNTSKASMVILNLYEPISVVTESFKPKKVYSSLTGVLRQSVMRYP